MEDDDRSFPHLPPNFITIHDLQERWLKRQQEKLKQDGQPNDQTKPPERIQRSPVDLERENSKETFRNEPDRRHDQPRRWYPRLEGSVRDTRHPRLPAVESRRSEPAKSEGLAVAEISVDDESSKRAEDGDEAKKEEEKKKKKKKKKRNKKKFKEKRKNEGYREQKSVESLEEVKERVFRAASFESQNVMSKNKGVRVEVENGTSKEADCVRTKGERSREEPGMVDSGVEIEGKLRHLSLKNGRKRGVFRSTPGSKQGGYRLIRKRDGRRKEGGKSKDEGYREQKDVESEGIVVHAPVEEVKEREFCIASSERQNVMSEKEEVRVEVENRTNNEVNCVRAKGEGLREGLGVVDPGVQIERKLHHFSLKNGYRRGVFQSTLGSNHGSYRIVRKYDGSKKEEGKSKDERYREQKDMELEEVVVHALVEEVKEMEFCIASSESQNVMSEKKEVRVEVENGTNKEVNCVRAKGEGLREGLGIVDPGVEIEGKLHHFSLKNGYRRDGFQSTLGSNHGGYRILRKYDGRKKRGGKNKDGSYREQKDIESEEVVVHAPAEEVKEREFCIASSESQNAMSENKEVRVEIENGTNKEVDCVRAKGEHSREGLGVVDPGAEIEGKLLHLSLKTGYRRGGFQSTLGSNHGSYRIVRKYDGRKKEGAKSKDEGYREQKDVESVEVVVHAGVEEVKEREFGIASSESQIVMSENKEVRVEVECGTNKEVNRVRAKGEGVREGLGVADPGVAIGGKLRHLSLRNGNRRGGYRSTQGSGHRGYQYFGTKEVRERGSGEKVWIKKGEDFEGSAGGTLSSSSSSKSLA